METRNKNSSNLRAEKCYASRFEIWKKTHKLLNTVSFKEHVEPRRRHDKRIKTPKELFIKNQLI